MEFLLIIVVFIAIFWFMSRGQKKQQQQMQDQMANLEPGTWVMTTTGFYGRLIDIDGDVAILETADGTETYWLRQALRGPQEPPFAVDPSDDELSNVDDDADVTDDADRTDDSGDGRDVDTQESIADKDDDGADGNEALIEDTDESADPDLKDNKKKSDVEDIQSYSAVEIDNKNFGKKND